MRKIIRYLWIALVLIAIGVGSPRADIITCDGTEEDCDTFTLSTGEDMPDVGELFADPVFDTQITRVTVSGGEQGSAYKVPFYATQIVTSAKGTKVLVRNSLVYNAYTLEYLGSISSLGGMDPLWDPLDDDLLYYRDGAVWYSIKFTDYDPLTWGTPTELHDFTDEYPSAQDAATDTKGDLSRNGRYLALKITHYSGGVITDDWVKWDLWTDSVLSWNDSPAGDTENGGTAAYNAKWIGISPSGQYLIMKNTAGWHTLADADFQTPRTEQWADNSHGDWALDKNGDEVYVWFHDVPGPGNGRAIAMKYPDTGVVVDIVDDVDGADPFGFHISGHGYEKPGWVLVSQYSSSDYDPSTNWMVYSHLLVELDPDHGVTCDGGACEDLPIVYRVAQTYTFDYRAVEQCSPGGCLPKECDDSQSGYNYWAQSWGNISVQGDAIYWGANWYADIDDCTGDPPVCPTCPQLELYKAYLPFGWERAIYGTYTPPSPVQCVSTVDNDHLGDGTTWAYGAGSPDPQCSGPNDNDEGL